MPSSTVVYDGDDPDLAMLTRFDPPRGPGQLVIFCRLDAVPPLDLL